MECQEILPLSEIFLCTLDEAVVCAFRSRWNTDTWPGAPAAGAAWGITSNPLCQKGYRGGQAVDAVDPTR